MSRRVFISVGEVSGDQHAALLIRELKLLDKDIIVEGIGGPAMAAAGAMVHYNTVDRAAMGLKAFLRYFELNRILKWTRNHYRQRPPDLAICVDSWTMNWHWGMLAKEMGIPVLYYVAPQMWASRSGRVKKLRKFVDRVACILPFEEKFFRDHGVEATFVGHPLFDEIPPHPPFDPATRFPNRPPVIGVVPGSRSGVARISFPPMLDVCNTIRRSFPQATFLVPTTTMTHPVVKRSLEAQFGPGPQTTDTETFGPFTLGLNQFNTLIPRCDLCLIVSGTATLHAAGHGAPQIVVYRGNPIGWHLLARWLIKTRTYSLVNLLNDSHQTIVPEFVPWYGSNQPVVDKALEYLNNPDLLIQQRERVQNLLRTIAHPGASRNAARLAKDLMDGRDTTLMGPS
jgi:lipid-A-disaccharide synthase